MEAGYLALYRSGELERRAELLEARLAKCDVCPHLCEVNRLQDRTGFCRTGKDAVISSYCAHHGEEPALSGSRGSGTIFFGNCNMRCVYCQNYQISQPASPTHNQPDSRGLAGTMLFLQNELHCHNINLVSPSHVVPQILKALLAAVPLGLNLPLVYNTGGYDSLETIKALEGVVDIYLPDMRYASSEIAQKYSGVKNYVFHNRRSVAEMYRQTGNLEMDEKEIALKGVIIRHLILPQRLAGSRETLTWLAEEVSSDITLSIMSQYYPCHRANEFPELARTITYEEYAEVVDTMNSLGMENGWLQEMDAPKNYLPDFTREGHPFESGTDSSTQL